jgi:hypothetical protein
MDCGRAMVRSNFFRVYLVRAEKVRDSKAETSSLHAPWPRPRRAHLETRRIHEVDSSRSAGPPSADQVGVGTGVSANSPQIGNVPRPDKSRKSRGVVSPLRLVGSFI